MAKLRNKEIEERAVDYVLEKLGKDAKDIRKYKLGYDIKYRDKIIEVKGTQSHYWKQNIFLSRSLEYKAWKNNKKRYRLYRVYNIQETPGAEELNVVKGKNLELAEDLRWRVKIKEGDD